MIYCCFRVPRAEVLMQADAKTRSSDLRFFIHEVFGTQDEVCVMGWEAWHGMAWHKREVHPSELKMGPRLANIRNWGMQ